MTGRAAATEAEIAAMSDSELRDYHELVAAYLRSRIAEADRRGLTVPDDARAMAERSINTRDDG